jgi:hypothetical protein
VFDVGDLVAGKDDVVAGNRVQPRDVSISHVERLVAVRVGALAHVASIASGAVPSDQVVDPPIELLGLHDSLLARHAHELGVAGELAQDRLRSCERGNDLTRESVQLLSIASGA